MFSFIHGIQKLKEMIEYNNNNNKEFRTVSGTEDLCICH